MDNEDSILDGIKVLDVGTFIFGPAAATVMADFGAEVIKIEPPGFGDPYRYLASMPPMPACEQNYPWLLDARNKKSVALDLKQDEGRALLLRLAAQADVFVTNFPPAVLERLRLRDEDLRPSNPRLIFAHATGFGLRGPEAGKPGYDATAWWGRSGLMDVVRQEGSEPGGSTPGMGDHPSAMTLFAAIMTALYRRERTGVGSMVTSSLYANGIWSNSVYLQSLLCGGESFRRVSRQGMPNATINLYECRDGRWFLLVMIREDKVWERFVEALGSPESLADPRFATVEHRRGNVEALVEALDAIFRTRDYEDWRERLDDAGITFGSIARLEDVVADPQAAANDLFVEAVTADGKTVRTVTSPFEIAGIAKTAAGPAPEIGEHTDEVLTAAGVTAEALADLRRRAVIG